MPPDPTDGEETSALLRRLPDVQAFDLELVDARMLTPAMRRLRLRAPGLAELDVFAGQDLMVAVPAEGHAHFRRRYTIRRLDRAGSAIDLDVVLHGDGPGATWARAVQSGDHIEGIGPRGKIGLAPEAGWHLFCGDESSLPATFAMIEALPAGTRAQVLLEVEGSHEEQAPDAVRCTLDLRFVHREGEPGTGTELADVLAEIPLPDGVGGGADDDGAGGGASGGAADDDGAAGHAYVFGELRQVAAWRSVLLERGFSPEEVDHKAYWRRGVANAAHGEPQRPDQS